MSVPSVPKYFFQDSDSSFSLFGDESSDDKEEVKEHVDLRALGEKTDFAIKVGTKNFDVHRKCLMEHSEYFRTRLANGTKESQQEYMEIENVTEHAVERCLDFIYKGKAVAEPENVKEILHAADLMQLDPVTSACFVTLEKNLKSANCITVYIIAKKYTDTEVQKLAKNFFQSIYGLEEIDKFLEFSAKQVVEFLTKLELGNGILWDAISNWVEADCDDRKENINDMISIFNWDKFPSGQMLDCLWNDNLFKESKACKKMIFSSVFSDLESLETSLSTENYFIIKKFAGKFKYTTKQAKKLLLQFFIRNFTLLAKQKEFLMLEEKEILEIYRAGNADILTGEKWKYIAAENWVKYDPKRISVLPNLLRTIRFDQISPVFLRIIADNRDLLQSAECSKIFKDAIFSQIQRPRKGTSIAILYSDGRAFILDPITKKMTSCSNPPNTACRFVVLNGKLCALSRSELFYLSSERKWVPKVQFNKISADEVITIEDCIYFLKSQRRYNAVRNALESVSEENKIMLLNGKVSDASLFQNGHGNIVVSCDGNMFSVYTTSRGYYKYDVQVQEFDPTSSQWMPCTTTTLTEEVTAESTISVGGMLYIFGNQFSAWRIEKKHQNFAVVKISSDPLQHSMRLSWSGNNTTKCYWPLNINGRLAVLTEKNSLFVYDELFDRWLKLMKTPQYTAGTENEKTEIKIISACTFTNDE